MKLEECRRNIDSLDAQIIELLHRRSVESRNIGMQKIKAGMPIIDLEREEEVIRRIILRNDGTISDETLVQIYELILYESRKLQKTIAEKIASAEVAE